jgi:hypothetical protein
MYFGLWKNQDRPQISLRCLFRPEVLLSLARNTQYETRDYPKWMTCSPGADGITAKRCRQR